MIPDDFSGGDLDTWLNYIPIDSGIPYSHSIISPNGQQADHRKSSDKFWPLGNSTISGALVRLNENKPVESSR